MISRRLDWRYLKSKLSMIPGYPFDGACISHNGVIAALALFLNSAIWSPLAWMFTEEFVGYPSSGRVD
jgi:hypothetical protein